MFQTSGQITPIEQHYKVQKCIFQREEPPNDNSLTIPVGLDLGEEFMSGENVSILHGQQEVLLFAHGSCPIPLQSHFTQPQSSLSTTCCSPAFASITSSTWPDKSLISHRPRGTALRTMCLWLSGPFEMFKQPRELHPRPEAPFLQE